MHNPIKKRMKEIKGTAIAIAVLEEKRNVQY
jgi:hypothetical protein